MLFPCNTEKEKKKGKLLSWAFFPEWQTLIEKIKDRFLKMVTTLRTELTSDDNYWFFFRKTEACFISLPLFVCPGSTPMGVTHVCICKGVCYPHGGLCMCSYGS